MTRDLPLANGKLYINFDTNYQLSDIFWPYGGQVNHTAGHKYRVGVIVEKAFSWIDDNAW